MRPNISILRGMCALLVLLPLVSAQAEWFADTANKMGTRIEINTYDVEHVRAELLAADGVEPRRYWPAEVHEQWMAGDGANAREAP